MTWSRRCGHATRLAGAALLLLACNNEGGGRTDSAAAREGGQQALRGKKPDPQAVMDLAKSYDFVNPSAPVDANTALPGQPVPDTDAPNMTIARAVAKMSPAPVGFVILAVVTSDKAYKPLGIEPGLNYIWRDETDADAKKWETYMVPANVKSDPKKMKRENTKYSEGEHTEPRLVRTLTRAQFSFGACLEDPACGSGHCGYGDTETR